MTPTMPSTVKNIRFSPKASLSMKVCAIGVTALLPTAEAGVEGRPVPGVNTSWSIYVSPMPRRSLAPLAFRDFASPIPIGATLVEPCPPIGDIGSTTPSTFKFNRNGWPAVSPTTSRFWPKCSMLKGPMSAGRTISVVVTPLAVDPTPTCSIEMVPVMNPLLFEVTTSWFSIPFVNCHHEDAAFALFIKSSSVSG